MTDNWVPRENRHQPEKSSKEKKLYQKPAFRYERVFETLALTCGKTTASGFPNCQLSQKTS